MSGIASASGLISGMDWKTLIDQLLQLDRQPAIRMEQRISALEEQRNAIRDVRTSMTTLRNRAQDFRLNNIFNAYTSASSEETVLTSTVSSSSPLVGSFEINVSQLASATSAQSSAAMGSPVAPSAMLNASGISTEITAGTFTVNGVEFTVDPATDSLDSILATISGSAAGVTATYDAGSDKVVFANTTPGDTSLINFGGSDDTSNMLSVLGVTASTQFTNGSGSTETTSTNRLGAISPSDKMNTVNFAGGAVTAGTFSINGISISIDPSNDALSDVLTRINESDAGVTASYDASNDTIRIVSKTLGSRTVNFGGAGDTSNFLNITNLSAATQTAGKDSQFTINGGPLLTRNSNEVSDAISGVTLNLLSTGDSTVTISSDDDSIVGDVQEFITAYNDSVNQLRTLTGEGGALAGDSSIRSIESFIRSNIFNQISGAAGDFLSLADIGISTGSDFSTDSPMTLELDEDKFREALRSGRTNVQQLFSNTTGDGVADVFYNYLNEATKANGFLDSRSKANGSIDVQIQSLNDQIDRLDERLEQKRDRMTAQFIAMETMMSNYQSASSSLSSLGSF